MGNHRLPPTPGVSGVAAGETALGSLVDRRQDTTFSRWGWRVRAPQESRRYSSVVERPHGKRKTQVRFLISAHGNDRLSAQTLAVTPRGFVAQLAEQAAFNRKAGGSLPSGPTMKMQALVEEPDTTTTRFIIDLVDVAPDDPELVEKVIYPRYVRWCLVFGKKPWEMTALGISWGKPWSVPG